MPALINPQHEQFARLLAAGSAKVDAYAQAFSTACHRTARDKGCRLAKRPEVEQRVAEMLEEGEDDAIWALAERLEYLRAVATTPHSEIDEKSPLCKGVKRTARGLEYKMPDKLAAMALYDKLAGDSDPTAGPERNVMGQMIATIRSNTWTTRAAEEKKGRVLKNWRHECFAQLVGSGERATYAYEKIYDAKKLTAMVEGHRLSHQPEVAERIAWIRHAGAAQAGWTRGMRLRYLRDLVTTPIGEIGEGSCYCQGIRRGPHGDEIKTPDKVRAIAMYSKLAETHQARKGKTIEQIVTGMRSSGNLALADGTERSLLQFTYDTVG